MLSIPKYFRRRQCINMIPKLCFNNTIQEILHWINGRTVMQFTYGDVEPNIIIPDGFVEGSNRCMNVKATTVCFSEPPLSNRRLLNETWTMTDLYFKYLDGGKLDQEFVQMLKIWYVLLYLMMKELINGHLKLICYMAM